MVSEKGKEQMKFAISLISGLSVLGILPQFGISLSQPIFGAFNVGTALGIGLLWMAYESYKKIR